MWLSIQLSLRKMPLLVHHPLMEMQKKTAIALQGMWYLLLILVACNTAWRGRNRFRNPAGNWGKKNKC